MARSRPKSASLAYTARDVALDLDIAWLKGYTGGVHTRPSTLSVEKGHGTGLAAEILKGKGRTSSITELRRLLSSTSTDTEQALSREDSLLANAQHNPLFHPGQQAIYDKLHRTSSTTASSGLQSAAASYGGAHRTSLRQAHGDASSKGYTGATALRRRSSCSQLEQGNQLLRLSSQVDSLAQQLDGSKEALAHLNTEKQVLQRRLSTAVDSKAESETAITALLRQNEQLQQQLQQVLASRKQSTAAAAAAAAAATEAGGEAGACAGGAQVHELSSNERKLVKFLKKLQKDKDRLNEQVKQLLESQAKLLQQAHTTAAAPASPQQQQKQQRLGSPVQQQLPSPPAQQQQAQRDMHSTTNAFTTATSSRVGSGWPLRASSLDYETQLQLQLQQLQQELDEVEPEQQQAATAATAAGAAGAVEHPTGGVYAAGAGATGGSTLVGSSCGGYSSSAGGRGWMLGSLGSSQQQQQHVQQQQALIDDQAATIVELKKVITELELQTSVLRVQASRHGASGHALADCQAALQQKEAQVEQLQQQQEQLQELSQVAIREAMRGTKAAEAERDQLKQQLEVEGAQRAAVAKEAEAARLQQEFSKEKEALSCELARLRQERQQLLQRLLEANEQITDLHDELGPAILRGSPKRRSSAAARGASGLGGSGVGLGLLQQSSPVSSRVWQLQEQQGAGGPEGSPQGPSDAGSSSSGVRGQLSAVVGELSSNTRAALAARSAAQQQLQEVQEAYKELQQQHGSLQVKHKLLQEEHAQLLNRQVGVTSQRSSLRQAYLTTEEQYQAAKQQIAELQNEVMYLKAAAAAPASSLAAAAGSAPGSPVLTQHQQLLQHQQMLSLAADNARLAVALAEVMSELELIKEQQQTGRHSFTSAAGGADGGTAESPSGGAGWLLDAGSDSELQQQRLQLLVSQLVMVKDQAAGAASLAEQQQLQLQEQQHQLTQLAGELSELQQQHAQLQREHLQKAQAAVLAAVKAAAEPGSAAVVQVMDENFKLKLELVDKSEAMRRLAAEKLQLQDDLVQRGVVEQLDAKNKALLQEVARLLSDITDLRRQLMHATPAADIPHQASIPLAPWRPQQALSPHTDSPAINSGGVTGSTGQYSRQYSRQPSLAELASPTRSPTLSRSASVQDPAGTATATAGVTPAAAAAATAAAAAAGGDMLSLLRRDRSFNEGGSSSMKVSWSPQVSSGGAGNTPTSPRQLTSLADAGAGVVHGQVLSQQQQQQQSRRQHCTVNISIDDAVPAAAAAAAAAEQMQLAQGAQGVQESSPSSAAAAAAARGGSTTPTSDRAALIAAVLDRQRSRISPETSNTAVAAADTSYTHIAQQQQQMPGSASNSDSDVRVRVSETAGASPFAASNSFFASDDGSSKATMLAAVLQRQKSGGRISGAAAAMSDSGTAAAAAAGGSAASQDRAALIAAVLQRQKAKQAGEAVDASFAFIGSGSGGNATAAAGASSSSASLSGALSPERSAGAVWQQQQQAAAGAGSSSRSGSLTGGLSSSSLGGSAPAGPKDRASVVAAVLAQRQQKQQAQAGAASSPSANASGSGGRLSGAANAAPAGSSPTAGGAPKASASGGDRAALVAAVLAKHHLGAGK